MTSKNSGLTRWKLIVPEHVNPVEELKCIGTLEIIAAEGSENLTILVTLKTGEKQGFVLTRYIPEE